MRGKKAQVTIFIIVAIVIVLVALLIYFFYPQIQSTLGFGAETPSQYMEICLEDQINAGIDETSKQGGSLDPEHYFVYDNEKVEYLCYQEEYYLPCVMQRPLLKQHIESELNDYLAEDVAECLADMEKSFSGKGYNVNLERGDFQVELLPKKVSVVFEDSLILSDEAAQEYSQMSVFVNNNLYELVSIASSILNWEARYGDSETTMYMDNYRDLKVEKKKQTDGTTVYVLTDRNNGNKFQFASRSVAWPPGYGMSSILQRE